MQNDKKMILMTENFRVLKGDSPNTYDVYFKDKKIPYKNGTIRMEQKLGYEIKKEELKFLPFTIEIGESLTDSETGDHYIVQSGHNLSFIGFRRDNPVINFLITDPRNDNDEYPSSQIMDPQYLSAIYDLIQDDERIVISQEYDNWGEIDYELQSGCLDNGIQYSPCGPIEFSVEIPAETFGELAIAADQFSYDLDRKATKKLK